ncbi:hypothetical protein [Fluviicola sp.]|uniref:hypothetical protein n=1 Tax=Fluviicola sp. TaxID=1917219 RepID=UPI0031DA8A3C
MKAKLVKYTIEAPCHEDWGKMKPEAKGRFCEACSKTVVDFSSMSDFSIVSYLENRKNESVCGRFRPDQMEKSYRLTKPHHAFSFDLKAVALGLALSTFSAVHTQAQVTPVDTTQVIYQEPLDGMVVRTEYYDHKDEKFTEGIILVDGKGFDRVTIQLLDVDGKEITSLVPSKDGKFRIPLNWAKNPASLRVNGEGLITSELYFYQQESLKGLKIRLFREELMLKGNVESEDK